MVKNGLIPTGITVVVVLIYAACHQHESPPPASPLSRIGFISFQVLDRYSKPFPGIPVRLSSGDGTQPDRSLITDARGEGTFSGLFEGVEYSLYVEPPIGMQIEALEIAGNSSTPPRQYHLENLRADVTVTPRDPSPEEESICEAVFRTYIDGYDRHYYLTLLGKDPSQQFLNRFSKERDQVFRGSQFEVGDRSTHISIYYIAWESESRVEVAAGYYAGLLSADGRTLILVRKDGVWSIHSNVQNWIS
jgi:hypothetical protein